MILNREQIICTRGGEDRERERYLGGGEERERVRGERERERKQRARRGLEKAWISDPNFLDQREDNRQVDDVESGY